MWQNVAYFVLYYRCCYFINQEPNKYALPLLTLDTDGTHTLTMNIARFVLSLWVLSWAWLCFDNSATRTVYSASLTNRNIFLRLCWMECYFDTLFATILSKKRRALVKSSKRTKFVEFPLIICCDKYVWAKFQGHCFKNGHDLRLWW